MGIKIEVTCEKTTSRGQGWCHWLDRDERQNMRKPVRVQVLSPLLDSLPKAFFSELAKGEPRGGNGRLSVAQDDPE